MRQLCLFLLFGYFLGTAAAQDVEYIRALERAQKQRPASLTRSARIAPASEPGTPLILNGRVVHSNGTPAAGAIVFAYHTDPSGRYDRREAGPHSWRLRGWARTDREGRFTFTTIRPGPYPGRHVPAHVHFTLFLPPGERYYADEVRFANDPLVTPEERDASEKAGEFGEVRPVRHEGRAEVIHFTLRIDPAKQF